MVFNVRHQQGFYIFRYFPCSHRMDTVSVKQGVCLYQGIFRKIWDLTGCIWDIYIADYTSQSTQCLDQKNSLFSCWRQIDLLFSCCQSVTSLQTFLQIFFSPVYCCQTELPGSNCFRIIQILISRHKFRQMTVLLLLAGCGGEKDAGYVARKLDIVLPQPAAVTSGDSHGGFHGDFHGDGLLHMELTFSQEDALAVEEAVSSAGWSLFPMEPELEERLYPDGAGASDWPDWPVPARGWWYLEDRQEDETEDMWQRYSYNYTFAVYDPDTGILYYQELDT